MGKNFELTSLSEVFALLVELVAGGWSSDHFFSLEGGLKNRSAFARSSTNAFSSPFSLSSSSANKHLS